MWVKINGAYHKNPAIIGKHFVVKCDDLDGCVLSVTLDRKDHRRKAMTEVRKAGLRLKIGDVIGEGREVLDGRLKECLFMYFTWRVGVDSVTKCLVNSDAVLINRPQEGAVNESIDG